MLGKNMTLCDLARSGSNSLKMRYELSESIEPQVLKFGAHWDVSILISVGGSSPSSFSGRRRPPFSVEPSSIPSLVFFA